MDEKIDVFGGGESPDYQRGFRDGYEATEGRFVLAASATDGPWHIGAGNGEGSIFADEGRMTFTKNGTTLHPICKMIDGPKQCLDDGAEDKANANLIAAAPDLLHGCRCALADLEGIMPDYESSGDRLHPGWVTIKELRAAIEKAEGKGAS